MAQEQTPPSGPDLTKGVGLGDFVNDKLLGHVGDEEVLLVRSGGDIFAVGAHCSHYHGPLAEGLVTGESVRCPWHHACFDLRTGEAERAPALSPIDCWTVEQRDGRIFVTQKREQPKPRAMPAKADTPNKIVIVGGGAAGFAAAEMLRRRGYGGSIVMVSNDSAPPVDRPNLSKDYLAGSAPEDWLPLRPDDFYGASKIDLRLNTEVTAIDTKQRQVRCADGANLDLRPAVAGDRRRAGAAAGSERRSAARPYAALARRLPRHHRRHQKREARACYWRELHRARSGGGAAYPQYRGPCRGAGNAADGARARAAARRLHSRAA